MLRPGASFGMIWNIEDCEYFHYGVWRLHVLITSDNGPKSWETATKWEQKLKDIIAELEDGHPRFRHMEWKKIFDKQLESTPLQALKDTFTHNLPPFSVPLGEDTFKWTVYLNDEGVWSRYSTLSQIANLEAGKREEVRKAVFDALKGNDVERNERGEVALHGVTYLAWTSRV